MSTTYGGARVTKLRQFVWENFTHSCYWCKVQLTFATMTVEHLTPRSKGGTDDIDNVRPACSKCNFSKGNRDRPGSRRIVDNTAFFKV